MDDELTLKLYRIQLSKSIDVQAHTQKDAETLARLLVEPVNPQEMKACCTNVTLVPYRCISDETINNIDVHQYIHEGEYCCDFKDPETGEVLAGYIDDKLPSKQEILSTIELLNCHKERQNA